MLFVVIDRDFERAVLSNGRDDAEAIVLQSCVENRAEFRTDFDSEDRERLLRYSDETDRSLRD